jgi:hypothetical protein
MGQYQKPHADLYTVMLIVALLAMIIGTGLLFWETYEYGSPPYQGEPPRAAAVLSAEPMVQRLV